jgi:hypothetical protein
MQHRGNTVHDPPSKCGFTSKSEVDSVLFIVAEMVGDHARQGRMSLRGDSV